VAFLAGIVLLFAGVEVQAVHVVEMRRPARGYPWAIGLAAALSLAIFALGAVPIAAILPADRIALQSGVFDAFGAVISDAWHLGWLTRLLSLLVGLGAIGGVFAWLGSPAKGLLAAAADGELPLLMQATNRRGMPKYIILAQGVGTTLMSALYFGNENVAIIFFLLSAMTIALYVIAYMLMYAAAIRLRYTRPGLARPFRIPGGIVGIWLVAGVGFIGVLFSFLAAFVPPDQLPVGSPLAYTALVLIGTVVFCTMPLVIHQARRARRAGAPPATDAPLNDAAAVKPIL
jgi:amino acid transporter